MQMWTKGGTGIANIANCLPLYNSLSHYYRRRTEMSVMRECSIMMIDNDSITKTKIADV